MVCRRATRASVVGQTRKLARLNGMSVLPSIADFVGSTRHVRFVPQRDSYAAANGNSITLSARSSSEDGKARPSALAVLRLTISSDLVGACTHLGLPYESHRLQAPDRKGSTSEVQQ
jgi:hypothetical protein